MMSLEKKLLNKLLDSYERSNLASGNNKRNTNIYFHFNKKTIPAYFDENSMEFEQIHAVVRVLEGRGFIKTIWRGKKENHIIDKIMLCKEKVPEVYHFLGRISKMAREKEALVLLRSCQTEYTTQVVQSFIQRLLLRLEEGKTVKEYMDIEQLDKAQELLYGIYQVEKNDKECFVREFSIQHFHDSKKFEILMTRICRVIREEREEFSNMDAGDIMAEYNIYHTPGYVYFKGDIGVSLTDGSPVSVGAFPQGIGLGFCEESLNTLKIFESENKIYDVYTIENLTSFFRFEKKHALIIYLGGYHNQIRRELLKQVYSIFPNASYYHFGDIDAGGFQILDDLIEKTGIPFVTYRMDLQTLKTYEQYGKTLTENDRVRLRRLLEPCSEPGRMETLEYMLENDVKLEQECIEICS